MDRKLFNPKPGDFVTNAEVASYALPAHKQCRGTGWVRRDLQQTCECAKSRFLDVNIFRVFADAEADALRWGPNPPTANELKEARQRVITSKEWKKFMEMTKPDKPKED